MANDRFLLIYLISTDNFSTLLSVSVSPDVIDLWWVLLSKQHEGFGTGYLLSPIYSWAFILFLPVSAQKPLSPEATDYPDELFTPTRVKTLLTKAENQMYYLNLCLMDVVSIFQGHKIETC